MSPSSRALREISDDGPRSSRPLYGEACPDPGRQREEHAKPEESSLQSYDFWTSDLPDTPVMKKTAYQLQRCCGGCFPSSEGMLAVFDDLTDKMVLAYLGMSERNREDDVIMHHLEEWIAKRYDIFPIKSSSHLILTERAVAEHFYEIYQVGDVVRKMRSRTNIMENTWKYYCENKGSLRQCESGPFSMALRNLGTVPMSAALEAATGDWWYGLSDKIYWIQRLIQTASSIPGLQKIATYLANHEDIVSLAHFHAVFLGFDSLLLEAVPWFKPCVELADSGLSPNLCFEKYYRSLVVYTDAFLILIQSVFTPRGSLNEDWLPSGDSVEDWTEVRVQSAACQLQAMRLMAEGIKDAVDAKTMARLVYNSLPLRATANLRDKYARLYEENLAKRTSIDAKLVTKAKFFGHSGADMLQEQLKVFFQDACTPDQYDKKKDRQIGAGRTTPGVRNQQCSKRLVDALLKRLKGATTVQAAAIEVFKTNCKVLREETSRSTNAAFASTVSTRYQLLKLLQEICQFTGVRDVIAVVHALDTALCARTMLRISEAERHQLHFVMGLALINIGVQIESDESLVHIREDLTDAERPDIFERMEEALSKTCREKLYYLEELVNIVLIVSTEANRSA